MIGRRSISVPGCDQNFPATGSGGSSALSPRSSSSAVPLPPSPSTPCNPVCPLRPRDKRGPAPVDNGPMALRMQAQDSALFEFVAFCLYLSAANRRFHLFPPYARPLSLSLTLSLSLLSLYLVLSFRSSALLFSSSADLHAHPRGSVLQIAIANLPALCLVALFSTGWPFRPARPSFWKALIEGAREYAVNSCSSFRHRFFPPPPPPPFPYPRPSLIVTPDRRTNVWKAAGTDFFLFFSFLFFSFLFFSFLLFYFIFFSDSSSVAKLLSRRLCCTHSL